MKKLFIFSLVVNLALLSLVLWNKLEFHNQTLEEARRFKPQGLKEGQCVIQVNGEKSSLFEQMKKSCRVLVVLDSSGVIQEILEKEL